VIGGSPHSAHQDLRWLHPVEAEPQRSDVSILASWVNTQRQQWIHEIKFDGFRLLAHKEGTRIRLRTKQGRITAGAIPQLWMD
jgi:hypothetical protein